MRQLLLTLFFIFVLYNFGKGQAKFNVQDSVCVGQSFSIENVSTGGSTFYWNFCSGSLNNTPVGENLGNIGSLNKPVYSSIIKDGENYYVFITNLTGGTITRLDFGNSLSNTPVGHNLGNFGKLSRNEGIQIKKDNVSGNWYGLVAGFDADYLARINFGSSLQNNTPSAENLGNIGNLMADAHTLYTFEENGNWYTLVGNNIASRLSRLNFGNSLANTPTAVDLGNIGALSVPVGFFPVQENGNWHMFVANQNNSISRLDFGSSLTNQPTGVNLGNIGAKLNAPRSIIIIRDCGTVFGFIVNGSPYADSANDLVRITFPGGLTSQPTGESLGNIANFSFPHHISQLFREGDSVYCLVTNVNNNSLSRFTFKGCTNPTIPSSNLKEPLSIKYDLPGTYNIRLVVDEGLPGESIFCRQITVGNPVVSVDPVAAEICEGTSVTLKTHGAATYLWSPAPGLSSTTGAEVQASPSITTTFTVTGSVGPGCSGTNTVTVNVIQKPKVTVNPISADICAGGSVDLTVTGNADSYSWSPADGLSSATSANVVASPASTTDYTVTGKNLGGCSEQSTIHMTVNPKPTITEIKSKCETDMKTYLTGLKSSGDQVTAKYGQVTGQNSLYTINNIPANISNTIISTISSTECKDSVVVMPPYCDSSIILVPEGFSPNNDGVNDYFEISGIDKHPDSELTVFNRAGQTVYFCKNYGNDWDGSYYEANNVKNGPLPEGAYYYVLKLEHTVRIIKGFVYIAY